MLRNLYRTFREVLWRLEAAGRELLQNSSLFAPKVLTSSILKIELKKSKNKTRYSEPSLNSLLFLDREYLAKRASEINNRVLHELDEYDANKLSREVLESVSELHDDARKYEFLVLIPNGWSDVSSMAGRTQGVQIEFLVEGLRDLGFRVSVREDCTKDELSAFYQKRNLIVLIWSLSVYHPGILKSQEISKILSTENVQHKIVGVITKEPGQDCMNTALRWKGLIDAVIYYEEQSTFQSELSRNFKVIHSQFIQSREFRVNTEKIALEGVFWSGLIKYNRKNWLFALKSLSENFGIRRGLWFYFDSLISISKKFGYASNRKLERRMESFALGLVLAHRQPGENVFLIGSFWNVYMSGQVPIVQHEGENPVIATYLIPNLDYFTIKTTEDLATVLMFSKLYPSTIFRLRKRILHRSQTYFSQREVASRLVSQIIE